MRGYFVLGSRMGIPPDLPTFEEPTHSGNHTKAKGRGKFVICTDLPQDVINLPSRDKQILLWSTAPEAFRDRIKVIETTFGTNYRSKILAMLDDLPADFVGIVNNMNVSTHGSLAIVGESISYYGLFDTQSDSAYLMWGSDADLRGIQIHSPLRYLVYRFPKTQVVFLVGESVCAKWWRWFSNFNTLHAFNALEMRLTDGPTG